MFETSGSFGLPAKTLRVRFGGPGAQTDYFECHGAIEAFLMGTVNHALTTPTDDFQQFIVAEFPQCRCRGRCFFTMSRISHSIRVRPGYGGGGRVANGHGSAPMQTEAILKKATWAAFFRRVGRDFRPAFWAKSGCADHCGESRSRAPSLFYCVKCYQRLCPDCSN